MNILVVDGMGGGIGKAIIEVLRAKQIQCKIIGVGTNPTAANAMVKAGADLAVTGENAVVYNATKVDYIIGPIGIVFANSMYGEITPSMAEAISLSEAHKILIPVSQCNATVLGVSNDPLKVLLEEIPEALKEDHTTYIK